MFTREDILAAMTKASKGHMHKGEVRRMLADRDNYCTRMLADITDGSYRGHIAYRQIMRTGNNGKTRRILSPSLYTRVLQIAWENAFGRTGMLPIEEVQIENQCGFNFRESTNQIQYIDEYEYQQSDCA